MYANALQCARKRGFLSRVVDVTLYIWQHGTETSKSLRREKITTIDRHRKKKEGVKRKTGFWENDATHIFSCGAKKNSYYRFLSSSSTSI